MDKLNSFSNKMKITDDWINAFYRMQGLEYFLFNFHSHQEYEIYFFHSGDCKYLINNRIYDLQPGDIILLDGMTLHKANPQNGNTYTRSMLHFSPIWVQGILSVLGLPNLLDPFQKLNNYLIRTGYDESGLFVDGKIKQIAGSLAQLDEEMQRTGKRNDLLEVEVKLELVQLLVKIYKMSQEELSHVTSRKSDKEIHAEEIASWINEHYTEKVSLERVASQLNLSKYYVSHVFKEVTGFTVMEYLMGCRLNQVKYLLEIEPDLTLAEVAHATGFESVAHFSRYFKEKVGMTPSNYRKARISKTNPVKKVDK